MHIVDYYTRKLWRLLSDYGTRKDPFTKKTTFHYGIDFGIPLKNRANGPIHIPVLTPFTGPVHATGNYGDRGLTVVQRIAGTNVLAVFQHLHRIEVRKGYMLTAESSVGLVGSTGRSTGVHLHFELRNYSTSALGSGVWGDPKNFKIPTGGSENTVETIVIDPGHGGDGKLTTFGTSGNGLVEKHLNLTVSRYIRDSLLKNFECKVAMTRNSDVDVSFPNRADVARQTNASLLFSVHFNGVANPLAHGFETFIYKGTLRPETVNHQHVIHDEIFNYLRTFDIVNRGKKTANFAMLRLPPTSCVLVEYCFLTNPREAEIMKRPGVLEKLGEVTAEGIGKARKLKRKVVQPPAPAPTPTPPAPPTKLPEIVGSVGIEVEGQMTNEPGYLIPIRDTYQTLTRVTYIISLCNQKLREAGMPLIVAKGRGSYIEIKFE